MAVVVADEICDLNRRIGVTSIVVSHDRDLAFGVADRIALLNDGVILAVGSPTEIQAATDPLVRRFLTASHDHNRERKSS
jgi:phospholipid/cholesterol/gamma-HCH transport system ATP-binding protein